LKTLIDAVESSAGPWENDWQPVTPRLMAARTSIPANPMPRPKLNIFILSSFELLI
jgi:hypothetical protein